MPAAYLIILVVRLETGWKWLCVGSPMQRRLKRLDLRESTLSSAVFSRFLAVSLVTSRASKWFKNLRNTFCGVRGNQKWNEKPARNR